jgi:endonuclease/exonuclease/phosphatase family metal-dependent hydrolase
LAPLQTRPRIDRAVPRARAGETGGTAERNLTLVTWNIAGGRTVRSQAGTLDYDAEDLGYFIDQIGEIGPDIACLQESHISDSTGSLAEKMADALGMSHVCEVPMHRSHIDSRQKLANAIISKQPMRRESWRLPDPQFPLRIDGKEVPPLPRHLLLARLQESPVSVATVHTNPDKFLGFDYEKGVGTTHAAGLAQCFDECLPSKSLLFAGDLNTDNPAVFSSFVEPRRLRDALPDAPTVPSWGSKPDHILYSPEFRVTASGIVRTEKADHYLSWAQFKYSEREPAPPDAVTETQQHERTS